MAWKDRLVDASFRGIAFKTEGEAASVGRRVETHEYDPICGFNNRELLISEVSFTKDNNGTITELRVGPPDAYLPEPENDSKKRGKKRKVKEDPF